jgi:bacterioferritin-associated ferredoxin
MLVCHCRVVSSDRILQEIQTGATCTDEVAERCGAGTGCGGCLVTVEQLLDVHTPARALAA